MNDTPDQIERQWARLGVLFNSPPAETSPDLERLIVRSATALPSHSRLLPLIATWLVGYGGFVAKHRLKRLAIDLDARASAALGLLLEASLQEHAAPDLRIAIESCRPLVPAGPLSDAFRGSPTLEDVARTNASPLSIRWGVWTPEFQLKRDAVRPVDWLLSSNPDYRHRIVRRGDLRCSILESLRRDAGGQTRSESALAHLSGATRAAVRKALIALVLEGEVVISKQPGNRRENGVRLRSAA